MNSVNEDLRLRAENLLNDEELLQELLKEKDISQIIHELCIHQIELEMQNDELRQTQEELAQAQEKFFHLYHLAPMGYFTFDQNGIILELNLMAAKLLGKQRSYLVGKPITSYLTYESNQLFSDHRQHVLQTHEAQTCELTLRPLSQQEAPIYVHVESVADRDEQDRLTQIRSTMTNITERRVVEQRLEEARDQLEQRVGKRTADLREEIISHQITESALKASEARYKRLLDSVTDYIYTVKIENGQPVSTRHGPNCAAVTGYTLQEYEANPNLWYEMIHEEDRPIVTEQARKLMLGESVPPLEHRIIHKDGTIRWVRHTPVFRQDMHGVVVAYDGLITDITERRRLAERLAAIHLGGQELTKLRDENTIFNRMLETAISVFECEEAGYGLFNKATGVMEYHYYSPPHIQSVETAPTPPSTNKQTIPYRSEISVLITSGLQNIGVLRAVSIEPDFFTSNDHQLLQTLADQVAVAVENARLYGEIKQRMDAEHSARQQAEMLREATAALTATIDLNEVLDSILIHLERVVPYDSACVFLWDDGQLQVVAGRGDQVQQEIVGRQYAVEQYFDEYFDHDDHPFILINSLLGLGSNDPIPGWMSVPLTVRGEVSGYLTLDSEDKTRYSQADEVLAQAFANQAAAAIHNAQLFEEVRLGHEQLQFLSRRLVEVQESERRQIARELHDEIGQTLTGLTVGLRLLEREASQPEAVLARVADLERTTNSVSESLHGLAINLRPASLDHVGLIAALRQHIDNFRTRYNLETQFEVIGFTQKRLPLNMETTIYRIVQEALTNVVRHAQASRVDIVLKWDNNKLITIIEDNGCGFDPRSVVEKNRLGLLGMRERAEMVGGSLVVESSEDAGTTILVEVPDVDSNFDR